MQLRPDFHYATWTKDNHRGDQNKMTSVPRLMECPRGMDAAEWIGMDSVTLRDILSELEERNHSARKAVHDRYESYRKALQDRVDQMKREYDAEEAVALESVDRSPLPTAIAEFVGLCNVSFGSWKKWYDRMEHLGNQTVLAKRKARSRSLTPGEFDHAMNSDPKLKVLFEVAAKDRALALASLERLRSMARSKERTD